MTTNHTSMIDGLLDDLNPEQYNAVTHLEGPLLILAGAGSGKTRVLTFRIANLIATGAAQPRDVLAMTFTNKAAGEMRERVRDLVPHSIKGMWVGTFHSLFSRMLRREADRIGYEHNFSIYDADDQLSLIKTIQKELDINSQSLAPKLVSWYISMAKNSLQTVDEFSRAADNPLKENVARIFSQYEKRLRQANAMDFDDLLIKPIELFDMYPLVLEYYQDRFRHILVDEYQDTNRAQYQVLYLLARKYKNICVVGDDDQSIYRWRGAELSNILNFEKDYPKCAKYHLEQNYRSTEAILGLAHSVVSKNSERHPKKLWTDKRGGDPVTVMTVNDEREEGRMIVQKIGEELRKSEHQFSDFAILYRINAQSRVLEDALRAENIPYVIIGGVRFYERKEIKDVLAYLRLLVNPADGVSLRRTINYPTRGIGETSVQHLADYARAHHLTLFEALAQVQHVGKLQKRAAERMTAFYQLIKKYQTLLTQISPSELVLSLLEELAVFKSYKEEGTPEAQTRLENIRELLNAIAEYTQNAGTEASLEEYLQQVSLVADIDNWDDRANVVTLMTLHAAKGLEFPVVFIAGLEEGLFPLSRSIDDPYALEEERRLFYVGATRAKQKLYLMWAKNRRRYGEIKSYQSRFLKEIDEQFVSLETSPLLQRANRQQSSMDWSYGDQMPNYEDQSQDVFELGKGMRVAHPKFGRGTILHVEGRAGNVKVLVNFDQIGNKRLVLPYAKLEIL